MLKGYRTMIVMLALGIIPVLEMTETIALIPDGYRDAYSVAVALVAMALRVITSTPVGQNA